MPLPFTYQRIQRQPWDERLPNDDMGSLPIDPGMTVNGARDDALRRGQEDVDNYPTIPPYTEAAAVSDQDPKTVVPVAPPAPAIDPGIINEAFARPDTSGPTPEQFAPQEPAKPALKDLPPPPVMISGDKYGRPDEAIGGADEIARNQTLLKSVRDYEPKKASGWRRYLGPILAGWAAGQKGNSSPAAGLGGAIVGALTGQFQPTWADKQWQKKKEEEVSGDVDDELAQAQKQAQIKNYGSLAQSRDAAADVRERQLSLRETTADNTAKAAALRHLNSIDYEPGKDPVTDDYFKGVFGSLPPAHKAKEATQLIWSNGQLLRVPKTGGGQAENVQVGGQNVVDPHRQANQSVMIGGIKYDNLTANEARSAAQAEEARKQRESQFARAESGRNTRAAQRQANAVPPRASKAVSMLSQYRSLGVQAQRAQELGEPATSGKLVANQKMLGQQLKQLYGDIVEWDESGNPALVSEEGFKARNGREMSTTEKARMNKLLGIP